MKRYRKPADLAALRVETERLRGKDELEYELLDSEPFSRPARAGIHARIRVLDREIAHLGKLEATLLQEEERRALRVWETESPPMKVIKTG